jgi:DNA-binding NarL/FixJ family response regulator
MATRNTDRLEKRGTRRIACPCNRLRSARQRQVLHLLMEGREDKHIARVLGICHSTVHDHLQDIYAALGVSGRCELLGGLLQLVVGSFECAEVDDAN